MLFSTLVRLVTQGYGGYPSWYVGIFSWATILFGIVAAPILTLIPWKEKDEFGTIHLN